MAAKYIAIACIFMYIAVLNPRVATANENAYRSNDIRYLVDEEQVAQQCNTGSIDQLVGSDGAEKTMNFLVAQGLTLDQAAGIAGNLAGESQFRPDIQEWGQSWGSGGWGIAQWTGVRRVLISSIAKAGGLEYKRSGYTPQELEDLLTFQLNYLWEEALGRRGRGPKSSVPVSSISSKNLDTIEIIKKTNTAEDAAIMWEYEFERAGKPNMEGRIKAANDLRSAFAGKLGDSIAATSGCGSGLIADEAGFHFPLITTVSDIKAGAEGVTWCYKKETNCHHDYPAADIHAPVGTVVVAAMGGKVVRAKESLGGVGSRVAIIGEEGDGRLYYYAHLSLHSLEVSVDDTVVAGQRLGTIGPREQAVNTPPHLHFDMLPEGFTSRPSCSGVTCAVRPFIDVQPTLKGLFDKMERT